MNTHLVYILACLVGDAAAIEIRSSEYATSVEKDIVGGLEYSGKLYESVINCGLKCLSDGCGYFATSQTRGGFNCVFSTLDLPRGHWDLYGNLPGKCFYVSNNS